MSMDGNSVTSPTSNHAGTGDYIMISSVTSSRSGDGTANGNLTMNMESLGLDLTLEEAVQKIRILVKENNELRNNISKNTETFRDQMVTLSKWKEAQEQERVKNNEYYERAKKVVTELRNEVASKHIRIEHLEKQIGGHQEELTRTKLQYDKLRQEYEILKQKLPASSKITDSATDHPLQHKIENLEMEKRELLDENSKLKFELRDYWNKKDAQQKGYHVVNPESIPAMVGNQHVTQEAQYDSDDDDNYDGKLAVRNMPNLQKPTTEEERLTSSSENDLRLQLRQAATQIAELKDEITQKDVEITRLQIALKDTNVEGLKKEITAAQKRESLVQGRMEETLQRERYQANQEMEMLKSTIQQLQNSHPNTCGDIQSLRNEVIQLTQTVADKDLQVNSMAKQSREKDSRILAFENKCRLLQDEVGKSQKENDDLIIELGKQSQHLMKTNKELNRRYEDLSRNHHQLKKEFDQLCTDYHTLLQQKQVPEISSEEKAVYESEIDRLSAQVMAAEDALSKKQHELQHMRTEIDNIQVYKAQAEIFRSDFEAERAAREDQHGEKVRLQEELQALMLRNQQLQDELQTLTQNQIAQMQQRHQSQVDHPAYRYGGRPVAAAPANRYQQHQPARVHQPQPQPPMAAVGQGSADSHLTAPVEHICPICSDNFPDLDSLELHAQDCGNL